MPQLTINNNRIYGLLIDMDGVLYIGNTPIGNAVAVLDRLSALSFPYRYVTNTTRMNRAQLYKSIQNMGFPGSEEVIFSAPVATVAFLKERNAGGIFLISEESVREDFAGLQLDAERIEFVVMGDPGPNPDIAMLNRGFNYLLDGAEFIAMQKNRYWRTEKGLVMDAGAYVAALEYSSGKFANIIGKPSTDFFNLAAAKLNVPFQNIAMIGDDLETDIIGAKRAGLHAILVRTGKYREDALSTSSVKPDLVIDSFAELIAYFH
jgi:HAD superfamily hydrolase (TIGR01458 family)